MKAKNTIIYDKSLKILNNLADFNGNPSLDAIKKVLNEMGNFQNSLKIVHITGTNGKGSTLSYLEAIYLKSGYSVGVFTSPYILSVNECSRINGENISDEDFATCLLEVNEICDKLDVSLSKFEILTVISLLMMHKKSVDIALVEVGIGSPLDATNVFDKKTCVFTKIATDHEKLLGSTPEEIAHTKSEIITKGSKVIIGQNSPEIIDIIKKKAELMSCEVFITTQKKTKHTEIYTGENAFTALTTIKALKKDFPVNKLKAILAIKNTKLKLRLEWLNDYILLDSAHNISGINALKTYLNKDLKKSKIICVFGVLEDKKPVEMLKLVESFSDKLILTKPISDRAYIFKDDVRFIEDYKEAIDEAMNLRTNEKILICGSFYLTAHAKKYIKNEKI